MEFDDPIIIKRLENIFMPFMGKNKQVLEQSNNQFVHYTSAENAINIIKTKQLWMRSPSCMNDYMEITHGYKQLLRFFNSEGEHRQNFIDALDLYEEGIALEILKGFDEWWKKIENDTFIASISVHPIQENQHGRLSMWRAYGEQQAKAAIVLNNPPEAIKAASVMLIPALYYTYEDLEKELLLIIENIHKDIDYIKSRERETVFGTMIMTLIFFAVCLKHAGFKEEKEWRLIHLPLMLAQDNLVKREVETISGIPQIVYKIELDEYLRETVQDFNFIDLLDKVIIGPTQYPLALYDAFADALNQVGVTDLAGKIITSDIPLRT